MSTTTESETVETDTTITPASLEKSRNEFFKSIFAEYPTTGDIIKTDAVTTLAWLLWKKHRYRADKKPAKLWQPSRDASEEDPLEEYWSQLPNYTPGSYSASPHTEVSAFDSELLFSAEEADEMRILAVIDAAIARVSKRLQERSNEARPLNVADPVELPDQSYFLSEMKSRFAPNTAISTDTTDTLAILLWRKSRWYSGLSNQERQKRSSPPSKPTRWRSEDALAPYFRELDLSLRKSDIALKLKITTEEAEDTPEFKELKAKLKRDEDAALTAAAQHVGDAFDKDDLQQFKTLALLDIEIDRCLARLQSLLSKGLGLSRKPSSEVRGTQKRVFQRANILNVFN